MRINIEDTGVSSESFMDFMNSSDFAKRALYYVTRLGHFFCDDRYMIERDYLDLYLLFFVRQGTLSIETRNKIWTVGKNQIALLDCHFPHKYCCSGGSLDFLWIHYNGCSSVEYGKLLYDQSGVVFTDSYVPVLRECFDTIIDSARSNHYNEHFASVGIQNILSHLAVPNEQVNGMDGILQPAINYINDHYNSNIDLERLASLCGLSISHLIRSFKRFANRTPHEYLLSFRLRKSKQLLLTTSLPIEQIAEMCGFNGSSHFARAFRIENAMSPSAFRSTRL